MKGTVKFFNSGKGFGFIAGEDGKEYFVHQTGVNGGAILSDNDSVTFDVGQGDRGPKAVNVSKASADSEKSEDGSQESAGDSEE
ncbi:cold shock domain-containing protein [Candidatus Woesearchaeota archaeon]|nr:cold shock domain-containing protein [Candidatus Woesearchaeota archaeon]